MYHNWDVAGLLLNVCLLVWHDLKLPENSFDESADPDAPLSTATRRSQLVI